VRVLIAALAVPELCRTMVFAAPVPAPAVHVKAYGPAPNAPDARYVPAPWMLAVLVNDPNRPKTNPAIAMAAMRVMAISITVARTGLIPFLRLACMFMLLFAYEKVPDMAACPLLKTTLPVQASPANVASECPAKAIVSELPPLIVQPAGAAKVCEAPP